MSDVMEEVVDFCQGMHAEPSDLPTVDDFLAGKQRSAWTYQDGVKAYVRRSNRICPRTWESLKCFDIGAVSCEEQGKGSFTKWLSDLKKKVEALDYDALYVECVATDRFANFFIKAGWTESKSNPRCFFLRVKRE